MRRKWLKDSKFGPTKKPKHPSKSTRKYNGIRARGNSGAPDPKETIRSLLRRYPAQDRDEDESDDKKRQPVGLPGMSITKTDRDGST